MEQSLKRPAAALVDWVCLAASKEKKEEQPEGGGGSHKQRVNSSAYSNPARPYRSSHSSGCIRGSPAAAAAASRRSTENASRCAPQHPTNTHRYIHPKRTPTHRTKIHQKLITLSTIHPLQPGNQQHLANKETVAASETAARSSSSSSSCCCCCCSKNNNVGCLPLYLEGEGPLRSEPNDRHIPEGR